MMSFQVQVVSGYVKSRQARSGHNKIRSDQVTSGQVRSCQIRLGRVMSGHVKRKGEKDRPRSDQFRWGHFISCQCQVISRKVNVR